MTRSTFGCIPQRSVWSHAWISWRQRSWRLHITALLSVATSCIPMTSKPAALYHCTVLSDLSRSLPDVCMHLCVSYACTTMFPAISPACVEPVVLSLGGKRSSRGQDALLTSQWTRVWSGSSFGWACQISTIRMIGNHAASEPCIVMYERHVDNVSWNTGVWWEDYVNHVMIVI